MPIEARQLVHIERAHTFWQHFFNEEKLEAFDVIAAKGNYHHNGELKDGTGLKKWVSTLQAAMFLHVEIEHTIPHDDRVALYWVSRPVRKADGFKLPSIHGMNVLVFDEEAHVTHNWNCMNGIL